MSDPKRLTEEEVIAKGLKAAATVLAAPIASPVVRQAREQVAAARDALKRLRGRDRELAEARELIEEMADDLDGWHDDHGYGPGNMACAVVYRAHAWLAATAQEVNHG